MFRCITVPVSLCPPQIPHGLACERTRASAVRSQRLTAWAMAGSHYIIIIIITIIIIIIIRNIIIVIVNSKIFWQHTLRRGRSRKQLLASLKENKNTEIWHRKEAVDCTLWSTRLRRGYGICRKTEYTTHDSVPTAISPATNPTKNRHGLRVFNFFQEPPLKLRRPDVRGWPIYDDGDTAWGHTHRAVWAERWNPGLDPDNWPYTRKNKLSWVSIMTSYSETQRIPQYEFVIRNGRLI
jgi:hypothetical protein